MQTFLFLTLSLSLALFIKCFSFDSAKIRLNEDVNSSSIMTFDSLCMNECFCGVSNHPINVLMRGQAALQRYQTGKLTNFKRNDFIYNLLSDTTSQLSLRHPVRLLYCRNQDNIKDLDQVVFPSKKKPSNLFLFRLSFITMQGGDIRRLSSTFFKHMESTLQYLDLSLNSLTFLNAAVFANLTKIQFIDLSQNKIREVTPLLSKPPSWPHPVIKLRGNPLQCTCEISKFALYDVIVAPDDFSFCKRQKKNFEKESYPQELYEYYLGDKRRVEKLFLNLCRTADHSNSQEPKTLNHVKNPHESFYEFDTHDEVPKQKYARIRLEERQHLTDKHCNDSFSQDGSKEQHHSHGRIKKGLDFPLLITMTAWFIMIYFGIKKFIRVNAMNNKSYTKYLQGTVLTKHRRSESCKDCSTSSP